LLISERDKMQEKVQNKTGVSIVVVGAPGAGKTPTIKSLIKSKNVIVYDPRYEYSEDYILFRKYGYFRKYITTNEIEKSTIIIEEATSFIGSFKESELAELLISIEHHNNTLITVFHSLADCPKFFLRLCKFVILFRTNDDAKFIKSQRANYYDYFLRAKKNGPIYIDNSKLSIKT
jgi:hypothetical protein